MCTRFTIALLALALLPAFVTWQGPDRLPEPPADRHPLPPVQEPYRTPVERRDLLQRFSPRHPVEGIYQLVAVETPGSLQPAARGYLTIGHRYLSIQLLSLPDRGRPSLQSAVRRYTISGNQLVMTTLIGFASDIDGEVHLDPEGATVRRAFELIGTRLKIDAAGRTLVFERVE